MWFNNEQNIFLILFIKYNIIIFITTLVFS